MYYLIYKITNKLNGKFYIGAHRTEDKNDGYMGSGVALKRAIKKYGKDNFTKEILLECSSLDEMFQKEAQYVVVDKSKSYNMVKGGFGGFCEEAIKNKNETLLRLRKSPEYREYLRLLAVARYSDGPFKGKKHTEETKKKIGSANSKAQSGTGNVNYGTIWIMNESTGESVRIKKDDFIPEGWKKGRKILNKKR